MQIHLWLDSHLQTIFSLISQACSRKLQLWVGNTSQPPLSVSDTKQKHSEKIQKTKILTLLQPLCVLCIHKEMSPANTGGQTTCGIQLF